MKRSGFDRRCRDERRQSHQRNHFENHGTDRRSGQERRRTSEPRSGWLRYTQWGSVYVGD